MILVKSQEGRGGGARPRIFREREIGKLDEDRAQIGIGIGDWGLGVGFGVVLI